MNRKFKRLLFLAVCYLVSSSLFAATPIKVIANTHFDHQNLSNEKIIEIIKGSIHLDNRADIFGVRVQPIFNPQNGKIDHLLVYLLSSKTYSYTITRIDLYANAQASKVIENYHFNKEDNAQQPRSLIGAIECPDNNIEIVTATPVPEIPTAKTAVETIANQAKSYRYKSTQLLGEEATVNNYVAYLSCPKLKGFLNIGHGYNEGIILADGILSSEMIRTELKGKFQKRAVIAFNSCEVFNNPLKQTMIDDADARKYSGGISPLLIGPSEAASQCFWDAAFKLHPMAFSVSYCNLKFDPRDQWGMGGKGWNFLMLPRPVA